MSTIQPETTITLTGKGTVDHAPDIAMISLGVQVEAKTAAEAMAQQAEKMNGVFAAVKAAGIADRDMQTGQLSLNPVYEYPNNARPRLTHHAGHQVAVLLQVAVVEVTVLIQVHLAAVDDCQQVARFDAEGGRVGHQRLQRGMFSLAAEGLTHLGPPPGQLGLRDTQVADLVHHVVDLAAEGVERGDGGAPLGRQKQEGVIEAAAGGGGFLLGVVLGCHGSGFGPEFKQPVESPQGPSS